MAGGIWYSSETAPVRAELSDDEPDFGPRIRGYDAAGNLIWDSARDAPKPGPADCVRTPDGRLLAYPGDVASAPDPATCRPAVPWTAGVR
ncbi:hypothetical protein [Embleya sp. NBC_00896]|uniref:hypothetical protein n=1 Tax=Embleya sp. NBC_00896 TaxID=2975961 RepID=UPI00386FBF2C|nr:hypothetical protein OG928_03510 [Embleya sp. NBC_00896]